MEGKPDCLVPSEQRWQFSFDGHIGTGKDQTNPDGGCGSLHDDWLLSCVSEWEKSTKVAACHPLALKPSRTAHLTSVKKIYSLSGAAYQLRLGSMVSIRLLG
jgi:hypothetical protein